MKTNSSDRKKYYQKSYATHGESPEALQWADYRAAALRYRELTTGVELEDKTILDAGCGMGDLLPYIYSKTRNFNYLGVDITPELVDIAKKRYSGHKFEVANPFDESFDTSFDVVFSSGVLNSNSEDWFNERKDMIKKLFSLTSETLVFNMAGTTKAPYKSKQVVYANCFDIAKYCSSLTDKVVLKADYHPRDFTVVLCK